MWLTAVCSPATRTNGKIGKSTTSRPAATSRARLSAMRSWLGSPSATLCRSTSPGRVKAAMRSTWPSVSRSSTSPWPSHTTDSTPR